ncbi:MAG TPA: hypothetical protein VEG38_21710 [Acidimicrobiia bacterium]|nr:hypothetical protein [Acidimicrobiia bacterium]
MNEEIDVTDGGVEIDLRDRLRFAADSLAADFNGALTADHAEALVFSSAEGLLATASVTEFVPILAERRARLAVRSGQPAVSADPVPLTAPTSADTPSVWSRPGAETTDSAPAVASGADGPATEPVFAVAADQLDRLRDRVDLVRVRVADWRAQIALR